MAHLLMVSIPAPGHVNPTLEVLRRLVADGHRVTYVNDPSFREVVEGTGATLVPYDSVLTGDWDGDAVDHLARFQDEYEAALPVVLATAEADPPDLVLYDIAGITGRLASDVHGVPALQLSPTYVAWEGYEDDLADFHAGLRGDPRGQAYLARQTAMVRDTLAAAGRDPAALMGPELDPLHYLGRPPRCVALVPETLQPHADRVDREVVTFTGPAVRPPVPGAWTPPGVDPATGARPRVLLVSLGSSYTRHPEFYRRCLAAYAGPGWHLVLQVGRHVGVDEVTGGGPVPDGVEITPWVAQREVLEHADVFVTHAGMGGSNEGLVTGTPMIAVPQDVDQFENADALVAAGVAVRLDSATATVADLVAARATVTAPAVTARSHALADELTRLGGVDAAVAVVEDLLRA